MTNDLGAKLRMIRRDRRLTMEQVGEAIKVSHQAIQQIETGKTIPKIETLALLAELYKISLDDVMIEGAPVAMGISTKARKIPLVAWESVGKWREQLSKDESVSTTAKVSGSAFALRVTGDSMVNRSGSPSFHDGMMIVCDPDIKPKSGDFVIAKVGEGYTFKRLEIDCGESYLKPLNDAYPIVRFEGTSAVVAVVKQAIIDL